MKYYRITVEPKSAFGTPLKGDTLFGQLCWALLNRFGEDCLQALLHDYTARPFMVCSDGFPHGYLPRPALPVSFFAMAKDEDRKAVKGKRWVPVAELNTPAPQWLNKARSDAELVGADNVREQPHNSVNRLTGTTGEGMFAPYSQSQIWYQTEVQFDIYLLLDESRLSLAKAKTLFGDLGAFGYGRDASIGLGKFECIEWVEWDFSVSGEANTCLTLAPCAPQGLGLDGKRSYYNVLTRFGRHGDIGVHGEHGPFKAPVLLADTAAVFSPLPSGQNYIGQGLGGAASLSKSIPETVHQGYAPYIPVCLPMDDQESAT